MKRTLTAFSLLLFTGAIAIPAMAQVGDASSSTSSSSESTRQEYHAVAPAPVTNSVETSKREYRSESNEVSAPVAPPEQVQRNVENKITTRTTTMVVPPPVVEETTTQRTTTDRSDSVAR